MSYLIPDLAGEAFHRCEEIIRRSRFIASLAHADTPDAARAFIDRIRAEFPDATHNCWAFACSAPGDTGQVGCSDDGEPHGTAGRPMLTALIHGELGETAVVVTRYFGGVKLGTGGLVRAYQGLCQRALEEAPRRRHMLPARLEVLLDYNHLDRLRRLLPDYRATLDATDFSAGVTCQLLLPEEEVDAFRAALNEATDGAALCERISDGGSAPGPPSGLRPEPRRGE